MDINKKFGERIRDIRVSKNLSQEKLAEISSLHRTYISLVERGKRNICLSNIEKLSNALDCSLKDLFNFMDK